MKKVKKTKKKGKKKKGKAIKTAKTETNFSFDSGSGGDLTPGIKVE